MTQPERKLINVHSDILMEFTSPDTALLAAIALEKYGVKRETNVQWEAQAVRSTPKNNISYFMNFNTVVFRLSRNRLLSWESSEHNPLALRFASISEMMDRLIPFGGDDVVVTADGRHHVATFEKGQVRIGCTVVPNETVRKIAERLKD